MQNYEQLILDLLSGDSPKEKYQSLLSLIIIVKNLETSNKEMLELINNFEIKNKEK